MMGFTLDETPTIEKTIGFELPDSDAKIFSMVSDTSRQKTSPGVWRCCMMQKILSLSPKAQQTILSLPMEAALAVVAHT